MNNQINGYLGLQNLSIVDVDNISTTNIVCNNIDANTGNIVTLNSTTGNITNLNSNVGDIDYLTFQTATGSTAYITTVNSSNLTIPTLTASKIVLSDINKKIISSVYTDTDMAIKSLSNTFSGTTNTFNNAINLPARTASKILLTDASKNIVSSSYTDTDMAIKSLSNTFSGTQQIFPLGSAPTPSLTFSGSLTTGIYGTASAIRFSTSGVERMSILSGGVINIPNLTASKLVLTDGSNNLVSSSYIDTDMAIKSASNTFSGTTNTFNNAINLPARTASKLLLTDSSKNIVSSTLNDTDLPTLSGSNTFSGTTNTFNNAINLPARTASKLLLTDSSKNIVSSTFTDTDLAPMSNPIFIGSVTTPDLYVNNTRINLGSSQTVTGLTTGCLIGSNLSNGGFNNVNMINGTGTLITAGGSNRTYISQLRNVQLNAGILLYDNTTKEVSYSATLPSFTTSGLTITGLTASRLIRTDGSKLLSSCAFDTTEMVLNNQSNTYTTGQQIVPLGTSTAPSISFSGDLNTGIYSSGTDTVNITSGGSSKLSVSSDGLRITDASVILGLNSGGITNGASGSLINAIGQEALGDGVSSSLYGGYALGLGVRANKSNYGSYSIALGLSALENNLITDGSIHSIGIGNKAGQTSAGSYSINIGASAGQTSNASNSISIGQTAGQTSNQTSAISIGYGAGKNYAPINGIAIGENALGTATSVVGNAFHTIAIGKDAMLSNTQNGQYTIAIGRSAFNTVGHNNSICINASGGNVNSAGTSRFYVKPIRQLLPTASEYRMYYNPTTNEITYRDVGGV